MPRLKIAVVEDEGIVAMDIRRALNNLGCDVSFIVDSGEIALEMLRSKKADAVIMDIVLKGEMDGVEAAKLILEKYNIPIVFLTAFEDQTTMKRAMAVNNYGIMIKPFEDIKLKELLDEISFGNGKRVNGKAPIKAVII